MTPHLVPVDGLTDRVGSVFGARQGLASKDVDALVRLMRGSAVAQTLVGEVEDVSGISPAVVLGVIPLHGTRRKDSKTIGSKYRKIEGEQSKETKQRSDNNTIF